MLDTRVLVIGCGAQGSAVSGMLSQWGFRHTIYADFDTYEESNATRTLQFPWVGVRKGDRVHKSDHLARLHGEQVAERNGHGGGIESVVALAQDLDRSTWERSDVVINACDVPASRLFVATMARAHGKPLLMSGFRAEESSVAVEYYPADPTTACLRCRLPRAPRWEVADTSCSAVARRFEAARAMASTPIVATAGAAMIVSRLAEGVSRGFPSTAEMDMLNLRASHPQQLGRRMKIGRDPGCPLPHYIPDQVPCAVNGSLTELLESVEEFRSGSIRLITPFVMSQYADDGKTLLAVMLSAHRVPSRLDPTNHPHTERGPLIVEELSLELLQELDIGNLPAERLALRDGTLVEVIPAGRATGTYRMLHSA
jgi:molybdopterin/thiamine biosynthesis adenylyltransferase